MKTLIGIGVMFSSSQTVRYKSELERNITIKLGYANAKIYKCEDERCPRPMCYMYELKPISICAGLMCYVYAEHMEVEKKTVLCVMCQVLRRQG